MPNAAPDERLETFLTPRDWLRYAVGRFLSAGLAFGHGATTALDEAAFLILEGLGLPIDTLDPFLDAKLLRHERTRLLNLIEARATTRKPAAYLLNRALSRVCRSTSTTVSSFRAASSANSWRPPSPRTAR